MGMPTHRKVINLGVIEVLAGVTSHSNSGSRIKPDSKVLTLQTGRGARVHQTPTRATTDRPPATCGRILG